MNEMQIDCCPVCKKPCHATEGDEMGRHPKCQRRTEQLSDEQLEKLIETIMNLTCEFAVADIVDAIAFHARATSEAADDADQRAAWERVANKLDDAIDDVMLAENIS